jgi:predicted RNA-binding Zn ribbon-like protein
MADTSDSAPPRPAGPAHVELIIAFANSVDHELGTDDLTTTEGLSLWLVDHGLVRRRAPAAADDLRLARSLRDGLHAALVANHDGTSRAGTHDWSGLDAVAAELPLRLTGHGARPGLEPVRAGVPGALSMLLVAAQEAVVDDTWRRIKVCAADECQWAYFDPTKNRSRVWCEWGCGNKAKTRSYRARRRAAVSSLAR